MSQVATKKKLKIRNERVKVIGYFHETGSVLAGTAAGFCDEFEVVVEIDSEEPPETIAGLVRLARRMCFTEQALSERTPVKVTPRLNGNLLVE